MIGGFGQFIWQKSVFLKHPTAQLITHFTHWASFCTMHTPHCTAYLTPWRWTAHTIHFMMLKATTFFSCMRCLQCTFWLNTEGCTLATAPVQKCAAMQKCAPVQKCALVQKCTSAKVCSSAAALKASLWNPVLANQRLASSPVALRFYQLNTALHCPAYSMHDHNST